MPLLGKKPFVPGSQLNSDSTGPVFVISHTKERFSSESEYQKRKELYAQSIWTCRATGHINLTHEEAMKSENTGASQLKEQFAKCFEKDVLEIVHHNTSSLDALVDQTWLKLHQQLVVGEKVNLKVKVADKLIPARVTSIDKSQAEAKAGNNCNSPSSDKENKSDDKDKTPKKWTPPKLLPYLYSIELDQEAKVIHSVPGDDLVRLERIPSKDLLRLFIRVTALRSGTAATSPWVVNVDLVQKYKLVNKFNDFFLSPAKMAEAAKRADENKKKRKLSNGVHAPACKKLKLDGKAKKDGKKLKVLQMNKTVKEKQSKKDKDGKKSPKKAQQKSPKKSSSPKKNCIVLSDSDDDVALSKLKKDNFKGSGSDSDVPLYKLVGQTTPKKKTPVKSKTSPDSSDEDVPLARISPSKKSSTTPRKNEKTPTKKKSKDKKVPKELSKKMAKDAKKSSKTGLKQATLFDLTKKGKSVVQKTPVKKSPTKTATPSKSSPPIPPIIRRLQNAKRESIQDKMKYSMMLKNAACILTQAQLKRVPEKLRDDIERKKTALEEKAKMNKMSAEEKEKYLSEKKQAAKKLQNQRMLQKMRDQRKRFEDTELDLNPLPAPKMVSTPEGFPNNLFGQVAMVTEFINCFGGLLMPDSDYPIFTDPLMKALVGGPNGFTYLSRVLTVLLQTLLQDEIAKGYKELNTLLSDIPVSAYTASELVRLCLRCEEDEDDMEDQDDETTKSIQLLNDTEFYQLELGQKLNLMSGLCSRVLETYSAQDYMEEKQKEVNKLLKQKASDNKQIAAQKKTDKQDSPAVNKPAPAKSDDASSSNENGNAEKGTNGCLSISSFYGKDAAQDSGEEGTNWGSVVKRRRITAAQAAAEKEKRDREKAAQLEKEIQMEKARRKQEQLLDAINLARMVLRQDPIGTDRHHDRYWVFTNTTPGLYIEKGWMGDEVHYNARKSGDKISDDNMSSDSDTDDSTANVAANQTGMTPMKVKYLTKRHFIEKSAPHPGQNIWLTYRSVKDLDALLKSLHPQGIRESLLKAEVKKRYDDMAKAITMSQRANLELRNSDGDEEMLSSFKKELCDMELRLRNGGLGGVPDYTKWEDRLNETSDIVGLGECMIEVQAHVTEKFVQGFMKPPVKAEGAEVKTEIKEEDESDEQEEEEESTAPKKKEDKNEKAFRLWKESAASCSTMSRLHVLLAMLDSCIKWEKSAENAKCKICRKKCDDDCLLLCDECNQAFHMYCLRPALSKVPTTDWFCPSCKPRRAPVSARLIESESEEEDEGKEDACRECGGKDQLIVCSKCPFAYHPECHDPPLRRPPRGVWECNDCKNGVNWKRKKQLSRKANQKKSYSKMAGRDDTDEDEGDDDEETEDEEDYTPKRKYSRSRNVKSQSNTASNSKKTASTRSRDRKTSPKNSSMRESTGSLSSSLTPTLRTSRRGPSELSLCEEVLSRVVKHKSSWPFLEPVDKKQVPDYHLYIKKPMDFQTMQKNCARLNYASPQEFIEDAALVFENAESYNKPDSEVFECMKEVEKLLKEQLKKLLPDWPYYRSVVEHHSCSASNASSDAGKRRSRNK